MNPTPTNFNTGQTRFYITSLRHMKHVDVTIYIYSFPTASMLLDLPHPVHTYLSLIPMI